MVKNDDKRCLPETIFGRANLRNLCTFFLLVSLKAVANRARNASFLVYFLLKPLVIAVMIEDCYSYSLLTLTIIINIFPDSKKYLINL